MEFFYESEHWESKTTVNDMDYSADNQKHSVYNTMKFTDFKSNNVGGRYIRSRAPGGYRDMTVAFNCGQVHIALNFTRHVGTRILRSHQHHTVLG